MPPKAKFTREEIVSTALKIIEEQGKDALTARSLGAELGSSARPIFTVFNNMEEVQLAAEDMARRIYESYEDDCMKQENAFKGSGIGYIMFAAEHPRLFQLLFMTESKCIPDTANVLRGIDNYYDVILDTIVKEYGVSKKVAERIYLHLWIYSHGIASLIATNVCSFTQKEISELLSDAGAGIIKKVITENKND